MQERLAWLNNNGYIEEGEIKNTKTTTFLMPLIGVSEFEIRKLHPKMLINAHVKNDNDRFIYIILNKFDAPDESKDYVLIEYKNENFQDYIEEDEEYILIYKVPEHFNNDYDLVLKGKYSQTSIQYKEILLRIYGIQNNTANHLSTVHDVLYPTNEKREQYANFLGVHPGLIDEVCSRPRLPYETFRSIHELKTENYGN